MNKGGVDLGIIELRAGKPPKLTLEVESADATALKTKLDQIDGPEGIALDMHLPPPSGKGRGPYGSRIVKYDDPLYKNAIQDRLERDFSVKQIPVLHDPLPPEAFKQLHISREKDKVGSIDFSTTPPKVTLITDKSERLGLENNWEMVQKRDPLLVRFVQPSGPTGTLVTLKAKPGDAAYPRAVALFLMTERYYLARHAYRLEFQK